MAKLAFSTRAGRLPLSRLTSGSDEVRLSHKFRRRYVVASTLLDRVMCFNQAPIEAKLAPWTSGDEVVARHARHGTKPAQPLEKLFALSDLRQVAGHRKDVDNMLSPALERLGIDLRAIRSGWVLILDNLYDQLPEQLRQVHRIIAETLRLG